LAAQFINFSEAPDFSVRPIAREEEAVFLPIPLELKPSPNRAKPAPANAALVLLNVLVYLLRWNWPVGRGTDLSSIFLYGFCHCDFWHLVLNLWVLWVFGNPVNRRLGNALYLLVYVGCQLFVGLCARILVPGLLVGSSGAIFAIVTIALVLMPSALIETAYVATFPLTLLLGVFQRPKYELNWFLSWGITTVTAWWCLLLIPLVEFCSIFWRGWSCGWTSSWTSIAHLLGVLCGVAVVLMLPSRITGRQSTAVF
jgi:membrane associated rhomboid family serine protease